MNDFSIREAIPEKVREELKDHPELVRKLLFYRGIETAPDAEVFLNPEYDKHTHDPFLLSGMDIAVKRILQAIEKGERIAIFGDYDADGIPGCVILHDLFQKLGHDNVTVYIPHRNTEGFGLNVAAIDKLAKDGVSLVITVDCGSTNVKEVAHAKELGIDVIITDHHLLNGDTPDAVAIINPNKKDDEYPNKYLCGAGVAFKLAQAALKEIPNDIPSGWEKWLLDMVAIATLSDMVSLTGENRVLAHYGLLVLRKSPRPGLQALLNLLRLNQSTLTEDDVVFMITPRINAASRMDHPEEAFKLLTATDGAQAQERAKHLNTINNERKGAVAAMVKEVHRRVAALEHVPNVLVIGNPLWKPGLVGLAAHAAMEAHGRPVFLWGRGDAQTIRGSCRSDGSVSVSALMEAAQDAFIEYGGHEFSGGFSVSHEHIHTLDEALNAAFETVEKNGMDTTVYADSALTLEEVIPQTWEHVAVLAPFGKDNTKPVFLFENISVDTVRLFGSDSQHVELGFQTGNRRIKAVSFFVSEDIQKNAQAGKSINLLATLERSVFAGRSELRLRIVDVL